MRSKYIILWLNGFSISDILLFYVKLNISNTHRNFIFIHNHIFRQYLSKIIRHSIFCSCLLDTQLQINTWICIFQHTQHGGGLGLRCINKPTSLLDLTHVTTFLPFIVSVTDVFFFANYGQENTGWGEILACQCTEGPFMSKWSEIENVTLVFFVFCKNINL